MAEQASSGGHASGLGVKNYVLGGLRAPWLPQALGWAQKSPPGCTQEQQPSLGYILQQKPTLGYAQEREAFLCETQEQEPSLGYAQERKPCLV